jgi:hypothetical protein
LLKPVKKILSLPGKMIFVRRRIVQFQEVEKQGLGFGPATSQTVGPFCKGPVSGRTAL